jgi:hypothetical protein
MEAEDEAGGLWQKIKRDAAIAAASLRPNRKKEKKCEFRASRKIAILYGRNTNVLGRAAAVSSPENLCSRPDTAESDLYKSERG